VRAAPVVVDSPLLGRDLQTAFVERDQSVQTLAAKTSTEPFAYGVRQRRPHRRSRDSYSEVRQLLVQCLGVDAIPVMDHEPIRMVARKRLPELLQGPLRRGMGGYVVMQNPSCSQFQDHEYIKDTELAVITTKKSHAMITLAWLRTKVSQRCLGSGVRRGPPWRSYFSTVRGDTRIPSFSFNSLAMRSSPHVGF
jgi:hypothetical protein